MLRILPFGGCFIHNPLSSILKKNTKPGIFGEMGLKSGPFSLSAGANHQLVDYLYGNVSFPTWVKNIAYSDFLSRPTEGKEVLLTQSDLVLVGMSTPTELIFEGAILNTNRFDEVIDASLSYLKSEKKLISAWRKSLIQVNEGTRKETSKAIYDLLPKRDEDENNLAQLVLNTHSRTLSVDDVTLSVGNLRDRLGAPMAVILYNFMFMPDGRPVQWPSGFKDDCAAVAQRLDLPTFDFAPFVIQEGVDKVMMDDRRHWSPSYYPKLGEVLYDFCTDVVEGTPRQAWRELEPRPSVDVVPIKDAEAWAAPQMPAVVAEPTPRVGTPPSAVPPRTYLFDPKTGGHLPDHVSTLFAVIILGGAWASGMNGDPLDTAVSGMPIYPDQALMFDAGTRPRGRDVERFVDLRERGGSKETPCAGIADQIMRASTVRFGDPPTMLFFTVAKGGTSLSGSGQASDDGLLRGSGQHREVMRLLERARTIGARQGLRLEVPAICLLHGEYEASRGSPSSAYRRGLSLMQLQYDADIRALTGQSEPIRLYLTQTNRGSARFKTPELAMAQLNSRLENPYVQCVGPTYFAPPEARSDRAAGNLKALGYRRVGQLFGRFIMDDLWGAQREPLRIEDAFWVGPKTIRLRYNRAVGLESDDSRVNISDLGPGLGVDFNDGTPWSPSVEAIRALKDQDNDLDVELTSPSQGYHKCLIIAGRTTGSGGVGNREGARSGIRSKEPFDVDPLDNTELFDWACSEQVVLA